jgi:hypothetical protein
MGRCTLQASWSVDGKPFCGRHAMQYVWKQVTKKAQREKLEEW